MNDAEATPRVKGFGCDFHAAGAQLVAIVEEVEWIGKGFFGRATPLGSHALRE